MKKKLNRDRKKILRIAIFSLAALCLAGAVTFLTAGLLYARQHTQELGVSVVCARQYLPAGTVLSADNVADYIAVKRIAKADVVQNAITLEGTEGQDDLLDALLSVFFPRSTSASEEVLSAFVDLQAMSSVSANAQLEGKYFAQDSTAPDERLYSIPMDYRLGMAGEIKVGDLVDLWVFKEEDSETTKIYSNARVFKLKGENNQDLSPGSADPPVLCIFKMNEAAIKEVRTAQGNGSIFIVKHGVEEVG
jgi:hypothetical protein